MKLALLKGNRFNPWHLQPFAQLRDNPEVVAFRAESEIQRYFYERGAADLGFQIENIHFDTQVGNPVCRLKNMMLERYGKRQPRLVPFADRLEGFDVIQTWELFTDWSEEGFKASERFGIPLAVMVWDNIPFNMERDPRRRERKHRIAQEADAFIVHTERSRRTLDIEGVTADRIKLINPGVDTEAFSPGPRNRKALGLEDDEFVILFVGWFLPRKGVDFLVLALRELLSDDELKKKRIRLVMVGSGPGRDRVEELINRLDVGQACTFTGSLPYEQMPGMYRAADVFVLPSIATPEWQEQFGMSLMEAMACGTPVVATLTGAVPEIADYSALLVQPNDFVSLYEALKGLILNPEDGAALAQSARERMVKHYNKDQYAEALSAIYEELLGG